MFYFQKLKNSKKNSKRFIYIYIYIYYYYYYFPSQKKFFVKIILFMYLLEISTFSKIISVKLDGVSRKNRLDNRISMNGYQPFVYSISGDNGSK